MKTIYSSNVGNMEGRDEWGGKTSFSLTRHEKNWTLQNLGRKFWPLFRAVVRNGIEVLLAELAPARMNARFIAFPIASHYWKIQQCSWISFDRTPPIPRRRKRNVKNQLQKKRTEGPFSNILSNLGCLHYQNGPMACRPLQCRRNEHPRLSMKFLPTAYVQALSMLYQWMVML